MFITRLITNKFNQLKKYWMAIIDHTSSLGKEIEKQKII